MENTSEDVVSLNPTGVLNSTSLEASIPTIDFVSLKREDDFFFLLCQSFQSQLDNEELTDTELICGDGGVVSVPSPLLAAISPVFRETAQEHLAEYQIIVPDFKAKEIKLFLHQVLDYRRPVRLQDKSILSPILDTLCVEFKGGSDPPVVDENLLLLDQDWINTAVTSSNHGENVNTKTWRRERDLAHFNSPPNAGNNFGSFEEDQTPGEETRLLTSPPFPPNRKAGKRPGRKKGQKLAQGNEPYVKQEIIDTPRQTTGYGLRPVRKKKKFADELSDDEVGEENIPPVREEQDISGASEDESIYEPAEDDEVDDEDEVDDDLLEEEVNEGRNFAELSGGKNGKKRSLNADNRDNVDGDFDYDDGYDDDDGDDDDDVDDGDDDDDDDDNEEEDEENDNEEEDDDDEDEDERNLDVETDGEDEVLLDIEASERAIVHVEEEPEELLTMLTVKVGEDGDVEVLDDGYSHDELIIEESNSTRSLLKSNNITTHQIVLLCTICQHQFPTQADLRQHVAKEHSNNNLFTLPKENPHRNCVPCETIMKSYEKLIAENPKLDSKNVCFRCPHCKRRFLGHFNDFQSHLVNDHRYLIVSDLLNWNSSDLTVLKREDPKIRICEFCDTEFANTKMVNRHLINCPANPSSDVSAGVFCHLCGKMFVQMKSLKRHLQNRHGKEKLKKSRGFFCRMCPVTRSSESSLKKHVNKCHSGHNPDLDFVLHKVGCDRCLILYDSYLENNNKPNGIPTRNMVFKCPHCCMLFYANYKHAPRYLFNHVNKFHNDPEINELTLNGADPVKFKLRSKMEEDLFVCEFCSAKSDSRNGYNDHLSVCPSNDVMCRPGYMCDTCGFIAGTSRNLRDHVQTQHGGQTSTTSSSSSSFQCHICRYKCKNERMLRLHFNKSHERNKEASYLPCPRCGKLRKEGSSIKNHAKKCGMGPAKYNCTDCDMDFKHLEDMQAHALIHYGQVTCPIHNILFTNEKEIYHHVNIADHNDKVPKLQCCMCNKTFRHMCIFMTHLRRHLRITPYKCSVCQKHIQSYASLRLHMNRMHAAEAAKTNKLFTCEYCNKNFTTKGHLKEHIAGVHERYNNVNCPVCHKSFNTQKRMKKHLFASHKEMADQFRSHTKVEAFSGLAVKI